MDADKGDLFTFMVTCLMCPTQAEGRIKKDESANPVFWYFRARHGTWTLSVGASPQAAVLGHEIASGEDPTQGCMEQGAVYRLVYMVLTTWQEGQP